MLTITTPRGTVVNFGGAKDITDVWVKGRLSHAELDTLFSLVEEVAWCGECGGDGVLHDYQTDRFSECPRCDGERMAALSAKAEALVAKLEGTQAEV